MPLLNLLLLLLAANPYIGTVTSSGSTARLELPPFEKVMVQCDADAYYLMGSSTVEVTSSTGARLTGNASPWPEKTEGSALKYIAVISVSGTANCKVWKDTRSELARASAGGSGCSNCSVTSVTTTGNIDVGGNLGVTGTSALTGAVTISHAITSSSGDSTGTPGNASINKHRGRFAIAVGASTAVISNSEVAGTSSQVSLTAETSNTGCTRFWVSSISAGSFTASTNANCTTSALNLSFVVWN